MKPRVWRESPGQWRCEVPGFPWVAFAPTWEKALRLGRSLMELTSQPLPAAVPATGPVCHCSAPGGSRVCGSVLCGPQVWS